MTKASVVWYLHLPYSVPYAFWISEDLSLALSTSNDLTILDCIISMSGLMRSNCREKLEIFACPTAHQAVRNREESSNTP